MPNLDAVDKLILELLRIEAYKKSTLKFMEETIPEFYEYSSFAEEGYTVDSDPIPKDEIMDRLEKMFGMLDSSYQN